MRVHLPCLTARVCRVSLSFAWILLPSVESHAKEESALHCVLAKGLNPCSHTLVLMASQTFPKEILLQISTPPKQ